MYWDFGDGRHEGAACAVVPDGRLSYELGGLGVLVQGVTGKFPRDSQKRDHEVVNDDDVVGWRGSCCCGWTGQFWKRVTNKTDASLQEHSVFVPFLGFATPPLWAEHAMKAEWQTHAEWAAAADELSAAQDALLAAKRRLDNAVARSRAIGLPWSAVASTLGITRQSAHARWRELDK